MTGRYGVPRSCQGQTVERSYLCAGEVIVCRTTDRSDGDGSVSYEKAEIHDDDWSWYGGYDPACADGPPPIAGDRWVTITSRDAEKLEES